MIQTSEGNPVWQFRTLPKDIGVAIVAVVFLLIGFLISQWVGNQTKSFTSQDTPFSIAYPSGWLPVESLLEAPVLKVQNPLAPSAFKTTLTVESRELDLANPPTMQQLLDRRVEQRSALANYHFLGNQDATVAGEKATQFDYAYVVQPSDEPRRASLPVVVVAREYIIVTKDKVYHITLAAPENDFAATLPRLNQMIQSVKLQ
jgi:hypothetical protein